MAAFIVRAVTGTTNPATYNTTPFFQDVDSSNPFFPHIQKLVDLGVTMGCSQNPPLYCPTGAIPRWELAMFMVRARLMLYGADFTAATTPYFADVPANVEGNGQPFPFIQRSYEEHITNGCGGNDYCPDELVTRGQMASFIMRGLFNETMVLPADTPLLTGVTPNTVAATVGSQITVTITGTSTSFQNGDTVAVPSGMLTVSNVVVNSATSISATLTANSNAVVGPEALVVTTGGQNLTLPLAISIYQQSGTTSASCANMSTGADASLNGFVPFPSTNAWNTDISSAPLDPNNYAITSAAGFAGLHLHHDFSSVAGGNYGIPYVVVDSSSTPLVPINVIDYADESDVALAPYPLNAPIEGAPADCDGWPDTYVGDAHVLVLDRHACMLYETFNTHRCDGAWNASSETIWDLQNYDQRPWGWTSADAAGLPIFPGLVRYDEVASGAINHAIRFTMQVTKNDANDGYFVEPASHAAGVYWGVSNVMGMRVRLNAAFDISGYSATNQVILTAMKKYGMILADNGGYFFFQGVADARWDDDDLLNLDAIQSSNFEVVQMTPAWPGWDSATAPTGPPPTINSFTASASTVAAGTPVTLTWDTSNDSYDFIDELGGVRGGSVTTAPTATTTYTLNATNQYGRSTAQVTVTVK
jgi:hypothetical protein